MATKHDLHVILFKWLQTLDLSPKVKSIEELSDGVVMARALNQIDPEWFPDSWLSKIKTDTGDNWRLKLSNLKKILEQVFDYYQECFNQPLLDFKKPDVVKIGDKCDPKEIGRLLQLILGCAVNCVKRQEYIEIIMTMNESEQRVLMECIQELDSERALSFSQSLHLEAPQLDQLITQLNDANMARDKLSQRCNELELQVQVLQEEKDAVVEERKKLQDEIESNLDSGATALRRQLEQMKGELFKLETSRDDYKQRCEDREKETLELRLRLEELGRAAAEARNLKDELDVLRDTADKVEKYEATIATYKKKLEETADLRREVKQLEAKNMSFIQQNIEMEEELKKASFWKAQFEAYKKQVSELEERLDAEAARGDKLSYELTSAEEQLNTMRRERERLIVERDSLRESVEELRCRAEAAEPEDAGSEGAAIVEPGSAEDLDASNAELRQRLLRLRRENARLRQGASEPSGDADSLGVLQTLLEDTRGQLERVRREYREANQKILQLEGELRDARGGVLGTEALARLRDNGNGSEALGRLADAQQALERERRRHAATIEDREQQLAEAKDIIGRLRTELAQKDIEIQEADDKYKKYVEKARSMLKLYLSHNGLLELPEIESSTLKVLDLSYNRLLRIDSSPWNTPHLKSLYLVGNRLTRPPSKLFTKQLVGTHFYLRDNPWICSCVAPEFEAFQYAVSGKGDASLTRCHSPSNVSGLPWSVACASTKTVKSSSHHNAWLPVLMGGVSTLLVIAVLLAVRSQLLTPVNPHNQQPPPPAPPPFRPPSPVHPHPDSSLPSYEEALLLPKPSVFVDAQVQVHTTNHESSLPPETSVPTINRSMSSSSL